ncbi:hypothetical protein L2E82_35978 [Cichorium intybus]|uniref:Uncharacterized protein n=1 Tax=Cichorium intybus TaxID=13427 RepID=A0ACB9BQJ7_CICIN|nr:hypothetical protein L2E82_35978 [Cichorium intybus]
MNIRCIQPSIKVRYYSLHLTTWCFHDSFACIACLFSMESRFRIRGNKLSRHTPTHSTSGATYRTDRTRCTGPH